MRKPEVDQTEEYQEWFSKQPLKARSVNKSQLKLKKDVKVKKFNPNVYLSEEFIGSAIMECLINNDPEGVVDLIEIYLEEHNTVAFLKEAHVPRSTVYQALKHKNPTIKTLAKIVSTAAAH